MQQNQIFETKQEFYNQIGLTKSLKDLEAIVKNYVMETFNNLAKNFPGVYSISWDQNENDLYTDPSSITVNGFDYFKLREKERLFCPESTEYFSGLGRIKVGEKYPLFKEQMREIHKKEKSEASKLLEVASIFSSEIKKIDETIMLLAFGKKVRITVGPNQFNDFHHPKSTQEYCDG